MQRYSGGLKVPAYYTDYYYNQTTDGSGLIDLSLTYVPKDKNAVIVEGGFGPLFVPRFNRKVNLTGKTLRLEVVKLVYSKPTTVNTTDAAGGGAVGEPHTHTLGFSDTDATHLICAGLLIQYQHRAQVLD
jgi:hypothetical protein